MHCFSRRVAVERELDKQTDALRLSSVTYDPSGNFLLYATPLGIKVINVKTNTMARLIGKFGIFDVCLSPVASVASGASLF